MTHRPVSPDSGAADDLADRLLAGEPVVPDLSALLGARQATVFEAIAILLRPADPPKDEDVAATISAIRQRLASLPTSSRPRRTDRPWPMRGAMILSALIVGAGLVATRAFVVPSSRENAARTTTSYHTARAQRATITLADGSRAVLAPSTTLEVASDKRGTIVTVQGQALFSVVHRADAPFTVRTTRAETRVLGTQFLVRQYPTDAVSRIVVLDGRVAVVRTTGAQIAPAILGARTLGVVADSGNVAVTPSIAINDYTAWTTGVLAFRAASVSDVVAELSRAYDADIRIADSTLAHRRVTWVVRTSKHSLADALDELPLMLDVRVVRHGKTVTLYPGRAASSVPRGSSSPPSPSEATHGR